MRKLTLNILQPVGREKLRLRSAWLPCSLVCAFVFPLAAFVISYSAGLSAIEGLHYLGLVPATGLHGLGLAWSQTSRTGLSIKARVRG